MEFGFPLTLTEIDGIDLSNYVRDPNSHNPIVYIHKRNLKRSNFNDQQEKREEMRHKCQQFDQNVSETDNVRNDKHDLVLENTIEFAKDLIPITIPPNAKDDINTVYYTIKTFKKPKIEHKCNCDFSRDKATSTEKKLKTKSKIAKTKFKKSISATETSQSLQNTADDTHNQSLSELSETPEPKNTDNKSTTTKKEQRVNKIVSSESFEGIADEYPDAGEIKIHLMNEREKNILYDNIRVPLIDAVKECVSQINTNEISKELHLFSEKIDNYSIKLDNILVRLSKIEKKICKEETNNNIILLDNVQEMKASKLEDLGEYMADIKADQSSGSESATNRRREKSDLVTSFHELENEVSADLDRGEKYPKSYKSSSSNLGIKPATTKRVPARFCWTDTKLN